jgi:hypothetical protein
LAINDPAGPSLSGERRRDDPPPQCLFPANSLTPVQRCSGAAVQSDQTAQRGRGTFADTAIAHHERHATRCYQAPPRRSLNREVGQALLRGGIIKKVARSIQSNATVQVLPGLAEDVPSPFLISCARKVSKTSRRTGLNSLPIVEQPALSISTSGASSPAKTQDGGSRLRTLGPA